MKILYHFLLTCIVYTAITLSLSLPKNKDLIVEHLEAENCEDYPNNVPLINYTWQGNVDVLSNGELHFLHEVPNFDFKYKVWKCSTRLFNRCSFIIEETLKDIKAEMEKNDGIWSTFLQDLKLVFPVQKGVIRINNARFSTKKLAKYPFLRGIWKILIIALVDNKPDFCFQCKIVFS